jgi:flagellar protein FliJ
MSHPLQALLLARELLQRQRDAAQLALQQAERRLAQTLAQGQTLSHYRADTQQRHGLAEGRPFDAVQLATAQGFTRRLDEALDQSSSSSAQAHEQAEHCRTRLTAVQMRLSVIDKLIERRETALRQRDERRLQRDTDERAAALARRTPETEESSPWH